MQLPEELHHGFTVLGIEIPGRLIGEQDCWVTGYCACDRHPLLLAARELGRVVLHSMCRANLL